MSEFRRDPVSGEWVIIAAERAKRPDQLVRKKTKRVSTPIEACPFEDLEKSGNKPIFYRLPDSAKNWRVAAIPNKYPALAHQGFCAEIFKQGPYHLVQGLGYHELLLSRGHYDHLAKLSPARATEIFIAMQNRYRVFGQDKCVAYAFAFYNFGPGVGASIYHPHYQLVGLPIIPPGIQHSLHGSKKYWQQKHRCAHCDLIRYEIKHQSRIVAQNKYAVAIAPFASRNAFEIYVYPRLHRPFFERSLAAEITGVASVLIDVLRRIKRHLQDPDLNFYVHSAPLKDQKKRGHYHWHIEILPKISTLGGFELGTGIEINAIDPDRAAAILRGEKIK